MIYIGKVKIKGTEDYDNYGKRYDAKKIWEYSSSEYYKKVSKAIEDFNIAIANRCLLT